MERMQVIITTDDGHILRNTTVRTLEEVADLHKQYPRRFLGLFSGEEMWLWVPEMKDWQ